MPVEIPIEMADRIFEPKHNSKYQLMHQPPKKIAFYAFAEIDVGVDSFRTYAHKCARLRRKAGEKHLRVRTSTVTHEDIEGIAIQFYYRIENES